MLPTPKLVAREAADLGREPLIVLGDLPIEVIVLTIVAWLSAISTRSQSCQESSGLQTCWWEELLHRIEAHLPAVKGN